MTNNPVVEAVLKRDRNLVLAGLSAIILLSAYFTFDMAQYHNNLAAAVLDHHAHGSESAAETDGFLHFFSMWTVMQVAMIVWGVVLMI